MDDQWRAAGEWPAAGLERVAACPMCGSAARRTLHSGLRDFTFKAAPGAWSLQECTACGGAYLDPRPDRASIGLAYVTYYTHAAGAAPSVLGRLRRGIAHAHLNHRHGTGYPDALPGGWLLAALIPGARSYLDVSEARHLERFEEGNARLLDVGCGSGAFLRFAAQLGWAAEGIDTDPAAVAAARAAGCNVTLGDLEALAPRKGSFRHITLNHVIEHVHHPRELLRQCFELLAPGGRLWLETPNLRAFGHAVFGAAWRGLEPPRHLVLLDRKTLEEALSATGFAGVTFRAHPGVSVFMWLQSRQIARESGWRAASLGQKLRALPTGIFLSEARAAKGPDEAEFLTCIAHRPAHA